MTRSRSTGHRLGLVSILLGIGCFLIGRPLDGFAGGLFTGMTIGLVLVGVLAISRDSRPGTGWRPTRTDDDWLPSRDEADR
jgi:hypothetical protein